ncbi:hypothetical protein ACLB2K_054154 [Fragaria x ananassa]
MQERESTSEASSSLNIVYVLDVLDLLVVAIGIFEGLDDEGDGGGTRETLTEFLIVELGTLEDSNLYNPNRRPETIRLYLIFRAYLVGGQLSFSLPCSLLQPSTQERESTSEASSSLNIAYVFDVLDLLVVAIGILEGLNDEGGDRRTRETLTEFLIVELAWSM